MDLPALRARAAALVAYHRRLRPTQTDSFPPFVDGEFRRLDTTTREIVQVIQDLNDRLTALGG